MANDTLFRNETSSLSGTSDYVKDVFNDVTLVPSNNTGYTDTVSRNPFGLSFANDDTPRYAAKKLFLKDLKLIKDDSKWINNQPTYIMVFDQDTTEAVGYVFGSFSLLRNEGQPYLVFKNTAGGCGITGIVRRVGLLSNGDSTTTSVQVALDGANTTTVSIGGLNRGTTQSPNAGDFPQSKLVEQLHAAANETKDIHDIRFTPVTADNFTFIGFEVYHENSGANIDVFPGSTYVNKTKVTSTIGATFALPTYGASLGGNLLVYKTESAGYASSAISSSCLASTATGSSGTNLLSVTSGHGASFKPGYGIVAANGGSNYVGTIQSISTDTFTMSPTLTFGVSSAIYTSWTAGPTYAIGATNYYLAHTIDFNKSLNGLDDCRQFIDSQGRYAWFSSFNATYGIILSNTGGGNGSGEFQTAFAWAGASGFINVQGNFQAADIVWGGSGTLSANYYVNGALSFGDSRTITTFYKNTVFTDGGNGWNSFVIAPGASYPAGLGIKSINLYKRNFNQGITYGRLGHLDTLQAQTIRSAYNATMIGLGVYRRVFSDQLYLSGHWARGISTVPGNAVYFGQSTNSALSFTYYGKDFVLLGTGASGNLTIDGASTTNSFNALKSVSSESWHTVSYAHLGGTVAISAIDYFRSTGEMKVLNKYDTKSQLDLSANVFGKGYRMSQFVRRGGFFGNGSLSGENVTRFLRLGSWISGLHQANGYTYSYASAADPTLAPSSLGYTIYVNGAFTSNDTNNKPTLYSMYVGRNKKVRVIGSVNGSYNDGVDLAIRHYTATQSAGCGFYYDRLSGVVTVHLHYPSSATSGNNYPYTKGTAPGGDGSDVYIDIIVEDDDASAGVVD